MSDKLATAWAATEAKQLRLIALQLFRCDEHEQHDDYRDQCGACVLKGYLSDSAKADGYDESEGPNYAGWARCYVQAERTVPFQWFGAFCDSLTSNNTAYANALKRDIATWGVRFAVCDMEWPKPQIKAPHATKWAV